MKNFKVGLELYSVREEYYKDIKETLKNVKACGYDAVEFFGGLPAKSAFELKAMLDEVGLVACGWHTPWHYFNDERLYAIADYNRIIGNKYIIVPGLPGDITQTAEDWMKLCVRFNEIAAILKPFGQYTGMHSHSHEMKPTTNGMLPWDIIAQNTVEDFQLQLDIGNTLEAGVDPVALLKKYENRYRTIHYKPFSKSKGFDAYIGDDDIDWADVVNFCNTKGGTEFAVIEYEVEGGGYEGVKGCIDGLKKFL